MSQIQLPMRNGVGAIILNNKNEASFPGTNKKDIFIGSKILDRWINE